MDTFKKRGKAMILGIDASTSGSGGAKRHLIELVNNFVPGQNGFSIIRIWGVNQLLDQLPESEAVQKISHPYLNKGFFYRTIWQIFYRDAAFRDKFDILFSPFGTYTGTIKPYVSMSRNMLIFDKNERRRFGFSLMRLKFKLLFLVQKRSFKRSQGVIFLSNHARDTVKKSISLSNITTRIIHHGVSPEFREVPKKQKPISAYTFEKPFKFLYVSTVWRYKHPWNVVKAIANLRKKGYPVSFDFVGSSEQKSAGKELTNIIQECDPGCEFVRWHKKVDLNEVFAHYRLADTFIFASTCENMPNILIEAMSAGLPIVCSSYAPMPEFLKEGGVYMDPTNVVDIELALEKVILDKSLRERISEISYAESKQYDWAECAEQTFQFFNTIVKEKSIQHVPG